jgi:hypothetical protein
MVWVPARRGCPTTLLRLLRFRGSYSIAEEAQQPRTREIVLMSVRARFIRSADNLFEAVFQQKKRRHVPWRSPIVRLEVPPIHRLVATTNP